MRFLKNIGIISRCTDMYRDDRFKELGINSRQAVYLQHICREPGITQDALGKNICVNKSNVTRQILLLEENGYVKRCPDESDRRQICVFPTDKAKELLPQIRKGFADWRQYLSEGLTEQEGEILCSVLAKIASKAADYCGRIVTEDEL